MSIGYDPDLDNSPYAPFNAGFTLECATPDCPVLDLIAEDVVRWECDECGLCASDLPEYPGIEPDYESIAEEKALDRAELAELAERMAP